MINHARDMTSLTYSAYEQRSPLEAPSHPSSSSSTTYRCLEADRQLYLHHLPQDSSLQRLRLDNRMHMLYIHTCCDVDVCRVAPIISDSYLHKEVGCRQIIPLSEQSPGEFENQLKVFNSRRAETIVETHTKASACL